MKKKADTYFKSLEKLKLAESPDPDLKETGTEQVLQTLCASLSVETYETKTSERSSCLSDFAATDNDESNSSTLVSIRS